MTPRFPLQRVSARDDVGRLLFFLLVRLFRVRLGLFEGGPLLFLALRAVGRAFGADLRHNRLLRLLFLLFRGRRSVVDRGLFGRITHRCRERKDTRAARERL